MGLKDWFEKMRERKSRFADRQDEISIENKISQRQLSADERELNKILEKERQEMIKKKLATYRKKQDKAFWHSKTALDAPNVMANHKSILGGKKLFSVQKIKDREAALFFQ